MYLYFLSEIELQNLSSIEVPVHNQQPEEPSTQDDDPEGQRIANGASSLTLSQTMSSPRNATKVLQTPIANILKNPEPEECKCDFMTIILKFSVFTNLKFLHRFPD